MNSTVHHDTVRNRFYTVIDGKECSADYEIKETASRIIDIYRTFVHPDLRGRGIAESLLKAVSSYAAQNGFSVQPSCSYSVLYYQRHPDQRSVLAEGVDLENGGSCRLK
ncbi:MAG: N-acetyltransferase [Chitinispirillaceae bacterium]|nr:N-acetyltransferase [Chitinispirillaceae bacterium]